MIVKDLKPLKRKSLATEVAESLRESIAKGALPPGTRLVEVELAKQLGVSRGPLREALGVLEAEGLVKAEHRRGRFVARLSERDISEVYSLRSILEQEAVRYVIIKGKDNQFEELENILNAMFAAAQEGNLSSVIALDLEFHRQLWEIADQKRLQQMLEELSSQIKTYLAVQTTLYSDLATGVADHKLILEAIRERDTRRATTLMVNHLNHAAEVVTKYARKLDNGENN